MGGLVCVVFSSFLRPKSMGFGAMNLWLFVLEFAMYMPLFKGILGWEKIISKMFLSKLFLNIPIHIYCIFMIIYITFLYFLYVISDISLDDVYILQVVALGISNIITID
jgi:hypothetical protein